jgi:hypothetical protein
VVARLRVRHVDRVPRTTSLSSTAPGGLDGEPVHDGHGGYLLPGLDSVDTVLALQVDSADAACRHLRWLLDDVDYVKCIYDSRPGHAGSGADAIEHSFIPRDPSDPGEAEQIAELLARTGTLYCPTIVTVDSHPHDDTVCGSPVRRTRPSR